MTDTSSTTTVCVTGATGFVGKNLIKVLENRPEYEVVALSRKVSPQMDGAKKANVTWRHCNGFSQYDVDAALKGTDVLIYLIHSMIPSTALSQGDFEDFDLYLADSFARAAAKNGVKKIIYLGGLIPDTKELSRHLVSRLEVETTLAQFGNKVTALRAGLIVGRNGSSFRIVERLIERLPALILPKWTESRCQPIDLKDVLASIDHCIAHYKDPPAVYDIGGPDVLSYRDILAATSKALGKKRPMIPVPFLTPELSKVWVARVTGTAWELVYPLIDSLRHDMVADPAKQLRLPEHSYTGFDESLAQGINPDKQTWRRAIIDYNASISFSWLENVTSIQRLSQGLVQSGCLSGDELAAAYFDWMDETFSPVIQVEHRLVAGADSYSLMLFGKLALLVLTKSLDRSTDSRALYYITGGLMARNSTLNGRFDFRWVESEQAFLVALLDFRPSLPWFIYKFTQAPFHEWVMRRFDRHLAQQVRQEAKNVKKAEPAGMSDSS